MWDLIMFRITTKCVAFKTENRPQGSSLKAMKDVKSYGQCCRFTTDGRTDRRD